MAPSFLNRTLHFVTIYARLDMIAGVMISLVLLTYLTLR